MKKNRGFTRGIFVLVLLTLAVFHSFSTAVWANSAMKEWNGAYATGVAVTDKYCPITVKHEELTFDIPMFPDNYYSDASHLNEYRASVTARYEFYNPKDYDVTATLAFPFGAFPDYIDVGNEDFYSPATLDRYGVKLDGEKVETVLRHTYFSRYGETFDTTEQLARLRSDYATVEGIDLSGYAVTAYNYTVSGTEDYCYASFTLDGIGERCYPAVSDYDYYSVDKDKVKVGVFVYEEKGDNTFSIYIIGKTPNVAVNPQLFDNSREENTVPGTVTLKSVEQMTFRDFALLGYDPESEISELDRYNAVVDCMISSYEKRGHILTLDDVMDIEENLMRWYHYDMTVPAGETVVNEVSAPIYPDINGRMNPSVYQYTYLLSPARSWAGFGKLDIKIITPYYLIESDIFPKLEKTESGYATSLDGLPSGELVFSLSSDPSPKREVTPYTVLGTVVWIAIIVAMLLPVPIITAILIVIITKKRRLGKK